MKLLRGLSVRPIHALPSPFQTVVLIIPFAYVTLGAVGLYTCLTDLVREFLFFLSCCMCFLFLFVIAAIIPSCIRSVPLYFRYNDTTEIDMGRLVV